MPAVVFFILTSALPAADADLPPSAQRAVDYGKDVQPILATHCFKCHGPEKQKGGLRLDDNAAALAGGDSGVVIKPGKSAESKLIHAVAGVEKDSVMPPGEAKKLSAGEIGILRAWIDSGAKGTIAGEAVVVKSNHWSFQPLAEKFKHDSIDGFIRERLAIEKLSMSPEADKLTLLRRVSLDITGLPPTPAEMDEYLKAPWPQAYEQAVDRLLASPHYGERWARHWLDLARYADSDGYEKDTGRPFAWRYRDYVINSLNKDKPYDRFSVEQLAGDLLPDATLETKTATGFHRNTLTNKEGGVDQEEFRTAAVMDRVNTTATVWLGLTMGCCQCHDHKYDPLSQREYYRFFAFFNSDAERDLEAPLPGEAERIAKEKAAFEAKKAALKKAVDEAKEKKLADADVKKREKALADHNKKPPQVAKVQTLELGKERKTQIHIRGDFLRKGVEVTAGTPAVLPAFQGKTRLDLAKWLVAKENPLTPRVAVNWAWSKFFGRGLVSTPEDFGTQGQKPSHPELLDWLAGKFQGEDQWSLKKLYKRIVMSEAYRQSSAVKKEHLEKDPLNVLLARQSRLRLEAEIVRDGMLAAGGLLTASVGGPSIKPPQPAGISELTYANSAKWIESQGAERYKRGMYIWFQRTSPYPTLMMFDEPDSNVCVVRRERSNTPLQALALLNDAVSLEAARGLAKRVIDGAPLCKAETLAFQLALCREPTAEEDAALSKLFNEAYRGLKDKPQDVAKLLGDWKPAKVKPEAAAAWVIAARAMMNLDEFVTRE